MNIAVGLDLFFVEHYYYEHYYYELQILKATTRGRPNEIIQYFAIAGIVSLHLTVCKVWADFEKRYGSDVLKSNHLFGKLESFPKIKSPYKIREI